MSEPDPVEARPCPVCGSAMDVREAPVVLAGETFYCSYRCALVAEQHAHAQTREALIATTEWFRAEREAHAATRADRDYAVRLLRGVGATDHGDMWEWAAEVDVFNRTHRGADDE